RAPLLVDRSAGSPPGALASDHPYAPPPGAVREPPGLPPSSRTLPAPAIAQSGDPPMPTGVAQSATHPQRSPASEGHQVSAPAPGDPRLGATYGHPSSRADPQPRTPPEHPTGLVDNAGKLTLPPKVARNDFAGVHGRTPET